ncbi:MAG: hypothetical protein FJ010_01400 [Chloroflexi bacterium]|nr:hypothetical protein [Chloroflexota bacterium]
MVKLSGNTLIEYVIHRLEEDEEIVVPIKKLWIEWVQEHGGPPFDEFTELVLADERIEEMDGVDHNEGLEWMSPEELAEYEVEMEQLGFFSGPRVRRISREITLEHIVKMITKHNDNMERALQQARESMPEDIDDQEEGALIDIIFEAKKLRRKLREVGLDASEDDD